MCAYKKKLKFKLLIDEIVINLRLSLNFTIMNGIKR